MKDFADFVQEGGNLLFNQNIKDFINNTDINKGIKETLQYEPEKWGGDRRAN
ncbi:hypothetical protein DNHGIG_20520 [Collibacillus ludicampi]|uniref:Uncharacterized protein n=1 Tax=Collibacillus ludicampi TaxID=2771369 RepID=A0AAV4LFL4_9BACL|nr:hypothetical protein DNHGIG_20520 [Collibacillus ludicampi]